MKRVAIIGGGASGLMAACFAAGDGNAVVIFEKQKKIGRKILVSGNGRCNISNRHLSIDKYHGKNTRFVHNVFARFGLEETIDYFASIGLPLVEEKNGKLFPASLQSATVVRLFEYELLRKKVEVRTHRKIERIIRCGKAFKLVTAGHEEEVFDAVILAAGSCAYPPAGGSRDGYDLAAQMKHKVYEPFPAILPVNIPLKIVHRLQGIKWDSALSVVHKGTVTASSEGELLFTAYGISGPASLDISRAVNETLIGNGEPSILVDLYPGYQYHELEHLLDALWSDASKSVSFSLIGIMKTPMPEVILKIAGIDPDRKVGDLGREEKRKLVNTLKNLELVPGKPRGFNEAVVAAGGVDVNEINPATMESRIVPGLFITGELLDVDGDSGGYNLQFAWSTGAVAGLAQH
ncbi:MAG TPA: NAD(P)/FAD-dependent oxidoreductase [Spirochaetota bacterium]|nr:NAD(P)/FAD-dependent oxidoreductase [Spirochaetota bacterium]